MKGSKFPNIYWCHSHFLNWMGGNKYILEVVRRLSKKYNVTVVATCFSKEAIKNFSDIGIKTISLGRRSTNSFFYWLNLLENIRSESRKLKKIVKNNDILITSMFPMNCIVSDLKNKKIQCCWEPYSLFYDKNYLSGFDFLQQIFIRFITLFYQNLDLVATRKADKIITLSKFYKRWIEEIYGRNDALISYEGVDTSFFKNVKNPDLERKYKGKRIVFHSTDFTAIKGTKYLIEAFSDVIKSFPKTKLLISSTIQNKSEMNKYIKYAYENGFSENLEFLGLIDYKLLPAYYSLADVVVQPAIKQNMSLPVKEAMSCQTPIITSKEGYEQTPNGKAGFLVNPSDPIKISKAIVRILRNRKMAMRMGNEGRKIILNKFTWENVTVIYEKVINDIIN